MDWLDFDLEQDRPATPHAAWPMLASKFELRTQLRHHSVVMPVVGDRGSFTAFTDMSDQDDDREPESASDGDNSEEEDETLSDDGSIHSSELPCRCAWCGFPHASANSSIGRCNGGSTRGLPYAGDKSRYDV